MDRTIDKNMTLEESEDLYVWYNYINPNKTVEIVNYMKEQADSGKQIFYSIYTEEEMKSILKLNKNKRYYEPNPELIASYATMELKSELDI